MKLSKNNGKRAHQIKTQTETKRKEAIGSRKFIRK
jgi:hypothetical protein